MTAHRRTTPDPRASGLMLFVVVCGVAVLLYYVWTLLQSLPSLPL